MSRSKIGRVVSAKADKTVTVKVDTRRTHPLYKKQYTISNKIAAHDEKNEATDGDLVEIQEVTPISKSKRWSLVKVLERQQQLEDEK